MTRRLRRLMRRARLIHSPTLARHRQCRCRVITTCQADYDYYRDMVKSVRAARRSRR